MNIKVVRSIHLYSGCFFTPLLIFFLISGALQTFHLHRAKKNENYQPPAIIKALSQVHQYQRYANDSFSPSPSRGFQILIVIMTIGLLLNLVMGVVLAFKFGHGLIVWTTLSAGILVPVVILYLPWLQRTAG